MSPHTLLVVGIACGLVALIFAFWLISQSGTWRGSDDHELNRLAAREVVNLLIVEATESDVAPWVDPRYQAALDYSITMYRSC